MVLKLGHAVAELEAGPAAEYEAEDVDGEARAVEYGVAAWEEGEGSMDGSGLRVVDEETIDRRGHRALGRI